MKLRSLFAATLLMVSVGAQAQVKLSPLFTSNMVMQQQSNVPVWGESKPGKQVTVETSWNGKKYTTTTDEQGRWKVTVETAAAGGPYTIIISDGKKTVLDNVLLGEVWICSGQSNMEMPVEGWGKVMNFEAEKQEANNYPNIRLLEVQRATSSAPLNDFKADADGWMVCSAETVAEFSAAGYFFGRHLLKNLNVPIGLINTSWGGTIIETWISGESLSERPDMKDQLAFSAAIPADKSEAIRQFNEKLKVWEEKQKTIDAGFLENWETKDYDDSNWKAMAQPSQWRDTELAGFDGAIWFRRTIDVPKKWAGKELTINLGAIDDLDMTFFNGVQVGSMYRCDLNRCYKIPASLVKAGKAVIAVRVIDTGGEGGFASGAGNMYVECSKKGRESLAGEWKYKISMQMAQISRPPYYSTENPNHATLLFNAMVNPLLPYTVRGAIWYQGESNADQAYQYRELMPLLIRDWRKQWNNPNMPFYFVQLANFMHPVAEPAESNWAELREAQAMTAAHVKGAGQACIIDIGEENDIHPKNKQEVGRRLALLALANDYGKNVVCSGPQMTGWQIDGNAIVIKYNNAKGLNTADGKAPLGFAIAGPDRKFHWAEAKIVGETVVVSSPMVTQPVAVRYAWGNNPATNLYNADKLPAEPFRTDDWPGGTFGKERKD